MKYTLISSERSPFGRICRMLMQTHAIPFEFKILNFVDDPAAAKELAGQTPINKVPVLIADGQKIFDSRVIVNFLSKTHSLRELTLDEENQVSAAYSTMDVSVMFFLMKMEGYDFDRPSAFIKRNRERILSNLNFAAEWVTTLDPRDPAHWNYASMSLYSCLYWAQKRALTVDLANFPALRKFMQDFGSAPAVASTAF